MPHCLTMRPRLRITPLAFQFHFLNLNFKDRLNIDEYSNMNPTKFDQQHQLLSGGPVSSGSGAS